MATWEHLLNRRTSRSAWRGRRWLAGTTPVGCVVLDADGRGATRGRGRRYASDTVPGQLSNSHLAHAELNVLAQPPTVPL